MDVTTAIDRLDSWRGALTVALAAGGFLLVAAATAWACTSQSHISSLEPSSAPAGAEVTVEGAEYAPGERVEVRWERDDGPVLATGTVGAEGTFAVSFTLPADAAAGEHLVFAIAPDLYPAAGRGSAMIHVEDTEPAPQPAPAPAEDDTPTAPRDEAPPAPVEQPARTEQQPAPPAVEQPATGATAPATANGSAPAAAIARPVTAVTTNGPGGTMAEPPAAAPPTRAWEREPVAAAPAVEAPAWAGAPDDVRARVDIGVGAAVLAVGLVVMFAGFAGTVLTGRRQRADARAGRD